MDKLRRIHVTNDLQPITADVWLAAVNRYNESMSDDNVSKRCCAICDVGVLKKEAVTVNLHVTEASFKLKDQQDKRTLSPRQMKTLLAKMNNKLLPPQKNPLPEGLRNYYLAPRDSLRHLLLSPRAWQHKVAPAVTEADNFSVCKTCYTSVLGDSQFAPKFSIRNGFFIGYSRHALVHSVACFLG
jgi:hypothetical protein